MNHLKPLNIRVPQIKLTSQKINYYKKYIPQINNISHINNISQQIIFPQIISTILC